MRRRPSGVGSDVNPTATDLHLDIPQNCRFVPRPQPAVLVQPKHRVVDGFIGPV